MNNSKHLTTNVIDQPFFSPVMTGKVIEEDIDYGVLKNTPLEGTIVEYLYRGVDNPDNGFTFIEGTNQLTFLSPNEIMERNVFNGKMFDILIIYAGMGWVHVYYYIPKTGKFGYRTDGGSNDYDREANYQQYSSAEYDPASFPEFNGDLNTATIQEKVQYSLEELLTLLKTQ